VQQIADKVGDSLELALYARDVDADIIVFAGVRFMAETAKILNPQAKVILPHQDSTCSLVTQTNIAELKKMARTIQRLYPCNIYKLIRRA